MDCNRDCFNCPYEDCNIEEISAAEIEEIESRNGNNKTAKKLARRKAYYRNNHESIRKYQLERYYRLKSNQGEHTCSRCFKPLEEGSSFKMCSACREKKRIYQNMKYRQKAM